MPPEKEQNQPNFILIRTKTPQEVVSLLVERFPRVTELVEAPDELNLAAPYRAYERFAAAVRKRTKDEAFLESVGTFINELADSEDPLIGEVLVVSLLEGIAEEPRAAERVSAFINEKAGALLRDVEAKIYGR